MESTTRPIETFRDGRLKASIWRNEGKEGDYHSVTFAKTYEDKNGKLQDSHSFTGSELLRVAELAREAHACIREMNRDHARERREQAQERPRQQEQQHQR